MYRAQDCFKKHFYEDVVVLPRIGIRQFVHSDNPYFAVLGSEAVEVATIF